jgi:hypothetical protein
MAAKTRADDRDETTELKLYLPAGVSRPLGTNRLERLWGKLFNHGVEAPK